MTKKDFELIASTIRHAKLPVIDNEDWHSGAEYARMRIAYELCDRLLATNEKFNPRLFLAACAIEE